MAKRKTVIDTADGITAEEVSAAARILKAGPQAAPPPSVVEYYEWNGQPGWRCKVCGWDTLNGQREMLAHLEHTPRCAAAYRALQA